jgi:hypothetical protein
MASHGPWAMGHEPPGGGECRVVLMPFLEVGPGEWLVRRRLQQRPRHDVGMQRENAIAQRLVVHLVVLKALLHRPPDGQGLAVPLPGLTQPPPGSGRPCRAGDRWQPCQAVDGPERRSLLRLRVLALAGHGEPGARRPLAHRRPITQARSMQQPPECG